GERIVGDFRIVREVGRGGMGIVYEAEQLSLGRRGALKVLPLAAAMDPRALQRVQLEAQATAWLPHHQIVPVSAGGTLDEVPYYAMQYIEGASLAELIGEVRRFEAGNHQGPPETTRASGLSLLARGLLSGRFDPTSHEGEANRFESTAVAEPATLKANASENLFEQDATAGVPPRSRGREYARAVAELGV